MNIIQTHNLYHQYDDTRLSFDDITIKEGEHTLVIGNSGVGKSTLLYLISGLMSPTSGRVAVCEELVSEMTGRQRDHFRATHISLMQQQHYFVPSLTALENITISLRLAGREYDSSRIDSLFESLDLSDKKGRKTSRLSQGEKQRLSLLRAVATSPKLIMADEPTSSVDDTNCEKMIILLKKMTYETNATLVCVTHDQRLKAHFDHHISL